MVSSHKKEKSNIFVSFLVTEIFETQGLKTPTIFMQNFKTK